MYLRRVPEVQSIAELDAMNDRLDRAFLNGRLAEEIAETEKGLQSLDPIVFGISRFVDIEQYKKDPEGWGHIIDLGYEVAYWRKFNALHAWMVRNVQGGEDDCGCYIVTKKHLEKLLTDLESLSDENKETVFPTQDGFFFGGTEYDDCYWDDVEQLKCDVRYILRHQPRKTVHIYTSSW